MPTPRHPRASHLDEGYLQAFDVTDTLVVAVKGEPETVRVALERLALTDPATRALHALGVADRLALAPTLLAAAQGNDPVFGLVWRVEGPAQTLAPTDLEAFDTPGHVKVAWDLRVRPSATEGSFLSTTTRFAATDETTRARLLAGWRVIGPLSMSLSQRTLATVKAYVEEQDEPAAPGSRYQVLHTRTGRRYSHGPAARHDRSRSQAVSAAT
jgi:hypothetical protein